MAEHAYHEPTTNPPSVTSVTPRRRTLFGAAALMALAIPARAADHNPDADLIAACAEYSELARRHEAFFDNIEYETEEQETARDEAQKPIHNAMLATVERIQGLPPVATFEGVRAIVRAVTIWDTDVLGRYNLSNTSVDLMDVLFESLAGDLVRGAA